MSSAGGGKAQVARGQRREGVRYGGVEVSVGHIAVQIGQSDSSSGGNGSVAGTAEIVGNHNTERILIRGSAARIVVEVNVAGGVGIDASRNAERRGTFVGTPVYDYGMGIEHVRIVDRAGECG